MPTPTRTKFDINRFMGGDPLHINNGSGNYWKYVSATNTHIFFDVYSSDGSFIKQTSRPINDQSFINWIENVNSAYHLIDPWSGQSIAVPLAPAVPATGGVMSPQTPQPIICQPAISVTITAQQAQQLTNRFRQQHPAISNHWEPRKSIQQLLDEALAKVI